MTTQHRLRHSAPQSIPSAARMERIEAFGVTNSKVYHLNAHCTGRSRPFPALKETSGRRICKICERNKDFSKTPKAKAVQATNDSVPVVLKKSDSLLRIPDNKHHREEFICLECQEVGGRLRVVPIDGPTQRLNCRFPRDLRVDKKRFYVETKYFKLQKNGSCYYCNFDRIFAEDNVKFLKTGAPQYFSVGQRSKIFHSSRTCRFIADKGNEQLNFLDDVPVGMRRCKSCPNNE